MHKCVLIFKASQPRGEGLRLTCICKGMKCRVLYLTISAKDDFCKLSNFREEGGSVYCQVTVTRMRRNVLGMNALFCEPKATPAPYP